MNLPNRLTLLRVCLIPVFLVLYPPSIISDPASRYAALCVFIIASLTDALDGYIARTRNLATNFGKLMDPMADKLLVAAALIAMVQASALPAWVVIIIISREFIVTGVKLIAANNNVVLAAIKSAKIKTATQMVMVIYFLLKLHEINNLFYVTGGIITGLTVLVTILSGYEYVIKNIFLFKGIY